MKQFRMHVVNGIRLNVLERGKPENPCIIFLHSFPDFHHGWRHQGHYFEEKNYYVVIPDQRGYNLSEKPKNLDDYNLDKLAQDIKALIDTIGKEVWLVGHAWGGIVAWRIAQKYPQLLNGLVVLNAPHPQVFQEYLQANKLKIWKNIKFNLYQIPGLMEKTLRLGNWLHFSLQFQKSAKKGTITEQDLKKYREAWSQPGAIGAMLNWQRAFAKKKLTLKSSLKIELPVLFVQGMDDKTLTIKMIRESLQHCLKAAHKRIPNAGHWVHFDQSFLLNQMIFDFINQENYDFTILPALPDKEKKVNTSNTLKSKTNKKTDDKLETAKQMKLDGLSSEKISQYTGLPKQEIEKL